MIHPRFLVHPRWLGMGFLNHQQYHPLQEPEQSIHYYRQPGPQCLVFIRNLTSILPFLGVRIFLKLTPGCAGRRRNHFQVQTLCKLFFFLREGTSWKIQPIFEATPSSHEKTNWVPSRELTYPTLGKGKSSSKCHFWGIC